ncbi:radical SAM family heme chaperone HemW [Mangrovimonas sp. AS39]|uniref:radical SAM family heme chaperone HemW n=1 Tax=Mangrovimonas futianensis TaxID=2895523 RepID=UPI001E448627|nr:radical SAM family heme chaperone HemW [Mangrovimonas futianensis]MCF1190961.1 radical SAM family heme chaperone HemW [Mangrovimonas futianensis]MCF1194657.1 radical SAM family heme chaperone HemW [Mangrovimonas futianensis]
MAGIYIHIPFCKQACHYCDFHFSTSLKKKDELVQALMEELVLRKDELKNQAIETIYFGGGTPSLLSLEELEHILNTINKHFEVMETPEITLEANPDDLTPVKIEQLASSPINRLSIGVQSFFEEDLRTMNRAHNSSEAKQCLELAVKHFDNITVDLIYGIPNMSIDKWKANLQTVFDLGIPHISSYALTVEPKTALASFIKQGKYPPVDENLSKEHFDILIEETVRQGYVQYEISNFGKEGYFSKHNTSYWQGKHYLGIGPSAHSFNGQQRSWNIPNNTKYIQGIQKKELPSQIEDLTIQDQYNEYVMTGLRTIWGVSIKQVEEDFGLEFKNYLLKHAEKFIEQGVLVLTDADSGAPILKTTEKGKFLADGLASELFWI